MMSYITKDEFDLASAQYPPNAFVKFIYRHFSKAEAYRPFQLGNLLLYILISLFAAGFTATVAEWPRPLIATVTFVYAILLAVIVISISIAYSINNSRLKKIIKLLGITAEEYNELVEYYYPKDYK